MSATLVLGQDRPQRGKLTWLIAACFVVFVTAAILRVGFVRELLSQNANLPLHVLVSSRYGFVSGDSVAYLQLEDKFAAGELLHAGSLSRPPGYPMFLWLCGRSPFYILIVQALLGSLIPICTLLLCYNFLGNLPISVAAGLVSAISPTGVGITGLILADLLLAVLFVVGLFVLFYGAKRQSIGWVLVCALLFGVGGLVKPVLLGWPVVSAIVWWLFRSGEMQRVSWTQILVLVLVQGLFFMGWASCNYVRDKVFTVSDIGVNAMRLYWAARVDEWARAGKKPWHHAVRRNRAVIEQRLGDSPPPERIRAYKEESLRIFRSYPTLTIKVFLHNINEVSVAGWNHFPRQIPLNASLAIQLRKALTVESVVRRYSLWLVMPGFLLMLIVARAWPTSDNRRICLGICGLSIATIYITLCAGVTFGTGPRIVYPIEAVAIVIVAAEVDLLIRALRSRAWFRNTISA